MIQSIFLLRIWSVVDGVPSLLVPKSSKRNKGEVRPMACLEWSASLSPHDLRCCDWFDRGSSIPKTQAR